MEKRIAEIKKIYRTKKRKVLKEIEADPSIIDRHMEEKMKEKQMIDELKKEEQKAKLEKELKLQVKLKEEEEKKLKMETKEEKQVASDKTENEGENNAKTLNKQELNIKQETTTQPQVQPTQPPPKSIGGNPMNPQITLQKQQEAEKERLKSTPSPIPPPVPPSTNPNPQPPLTSPAPTSSSPVPAPSTKPLATPPIPSSPTPILTPPVLSPKAQYLLDTFETSPEITVLHKEKLRRVDQIARIKRKLENPSAVKEEGLKHIEVDHPEQFRLKTKGFAVPFNTVDKDDKVRI